MKIAAYDLDSLKVYSLEFLIDIKLNFFLKDG